METNLYKVSGICWAVSSNREDDPQVFETVDKAADYLLEIGIDDNQIDLALIDMMANGHTRANFGVKGSFIFSDGARLNGQFGIA